MLIFKVGESIVSSEDFTQINFETVYDRFTKTYINRFVGQIPANKATEIINFLINNLSNNIDVGYETNFLHQSKILYLNTDIIQNICRMELQQGLE